MRQRTLWAMTLVSQLPGYPSIACLSGFQATLVVLMTDSQAYSHLMTTTRLSTGEHSRFQCSLDAYILVNAVAKKCLDPTRPPPASRPCRGSQKASVINARPSRSPPACLNELRNVPRKPSGLSTGNPALPGKDLACWMPTSDLDNDVARPGWPTPTLLSNIRRGLCLRLARPPR